MIKKFLAQILLLSISSLAIAQQLHYSDVKKLETNINTSGEESHPMISATGDTLFFSRTNYNENIGGKLAGSDIWYTVINEGSWSGTANNFSQLNNGDGNAIIGFGSASDMIYLINTYSPPARRNRAIAYTKKEKGKWVAPIELDLKLDMKGTFYSFYMHPDEDVLIISMNREDSEGLEDLYISTRSDESWSEPVNLGESINTGGYEISPFLSADKDSLFFASNGHDGQGDADIYVSTRIGDGYQQWSKPTNLGSPINSKAFDAYYIQRKNSAYFSSNRDGSNDLYVANITLAPVNLTSEEPTKNKEIEKAYIEDSEETKVAEVEKSENEEAPKLKTLEQNVYFAFDSDELKPESKKVLDELVKNKNYPDLRKMKISIVGYTDNIGSQEYNQKLAERRASAVKNYFISQRFSEESIRTESKGESEPVAPNGNEEGRKMNRRVKITMN